MLGLALGREVLGGRVAEHADPRVSENVGRAVLVGDALVDGSQDWVAYRLVLPAVQLADVLQLVVVVVHARVSAALAASLAVEDRSLSCIILALFVCIIHDSSVVSNSACMFSCLHIRILYRQTTHTEREKSDLLFLQELSAKQTQTDKFTD